LPYDICISGDSVNAALYYSSRSSAILRLLAHFDAQPAVAALDSQFQMPPLAHVLQRTRSARFIDMLMLLSSDIDYFV